MQIGSQEFGNEIAVVTKNQQAERFGPERTGLHVLERRNEDIAQADDLEHFSACVQCQ